MEINNNEFDDFIRKSTDKSLEVPSKLGLDWDSMNITSENENDLETRIIDQLFIDGVQHAPSIDLDLSWESMDISTNKKKSRRYGFIVLFSFLFILLSSAGYFLVLDNQSGFMTTSNNTNMPEVIIENFDTPISKNGSLSNSNESHNNVLANNSLATNNYKNTASQPNSKTGSANYSLEEESSNGQLVNNVTSNKSSEALDSIMSHLNSSSVDSNLNNEGLITNDQRNREFVTIDVLPRVLLNRVDFPLVIPKNIKIKYQLPYFDTLNNILKKNLFTVYGMFGKNFGEIQLDNNSQLSSELGSGYGIDGVLGFKVRVSENLAINAGLNYTRINSTLSETRTVSRVRNIATNKIVLTSINFHQNNFSHYAGLFAGLDYNLYTLGAFELSLGININVNKSISHSAVILGDDNRLKEALDPSADIGLNYSLKPNVQMEYKLSNRIRLMGDISAQYVVRNNFYIMESASLSTLYQFKLGLGYSF